MAQIAPFRGLRYNVQKVPDLSEVVIPPYDVISPPEQEAFHRINPYNMVRLELGQTTVQDSESDNPYTRAAAFLQRWQEERIFIREDRPAIYYSELDYALASGACLTRRGFICALRLEDFGSGRVRPHEKTFQTVKDERLRLMLSCHANLSPVFALYPDAEQSVDEALRGGREADPIFTFTDNYGMAHRMWRVTDPAVIQRAMDEMQEKALFIADGHHRYETALTYRALQRERFPEAGPGAAFEHIMVYLSNLNQEGLTILPTHRMLRHLGSWDILSFLGRAQNFFEVSRYDTTDMGQSRWQADLEAGHTNRHTVIGFYAQKAQGFYLLRARPQAVSSYLTQQGIPSALHDLDVVVLDQVILRKLMKLSETFLANEHNIHFKHDLLDALAGLKAEHYEAGFLINATRIEQVQHVAGSGLVMPHKSTYFYPKVGSGMVIHLLSAEEEVPR